MQFPNLDKILALDSLIVLNFNTEWCPACREFKPTFFKIGKEFKGKCTFAFIDAETCYDVLDEYHITQLPTTVYFKDKQVKFLHQGLLSEENLREKVNALCNLV